MFLVLCAFSWLPDPYWVVALLNFMPLLLIQNVADDIAILRNQKDQQFQKFNVWNWVGIALMSVLLLLAIVGIYPEFAPQFFGDL